MPLASNPTKRFLSSILILFVFFPGAVSGASSPPGALFAAAPFSGGSGGGDHSTSLVLSLTSLSAVLHSFDVAAEGHARRISWRVSGAGPECYAVERSFDGLHFTGIHQLPVSGNPPEKHLYTFLDADPLNGGVFYRLHWQEADGRYRYSDTRFLSVEPAAWNFSVFTPPGETGRMELRFSGVDPSETLDLTVHTLGGRRVLHRQAEGPRQHVPVELPGGLPGGIYVCTVNRADGSVRSRLIPLLR